jgi:hypothetical protein
VTTLSELINPTPAPTTPTTTAVAGLPVEYQSQLDRIALQKALAQVQLQRAASVPTQGQMISGHYIPVPALAAAGGAISDVAGTLQMLAAMKQQNQVQQQYQTDHAADLANVVSKLQPSTTTTQPEADELNIDANGRPILPAPVTTATPPDTAGAITTAMQSKFPDIQALAQKLTDAQTKRLEVASPFATPQSAVRAAQTGNISDLQPYQTPGVQTMQVDDGNGGKQNVVFTTDSKGQVTFAPAGNSVTNNMGTSLTDQIGSDAVKRFSGGKAANDQASKALDTLNTLAEIQNSGVLQNGSESERIVALQKLAGRAGFPVPASVPNSEVYGSQLFGLLKDNLEAFKGRTSNKDVAIALGQLPATDQERAGAMGNIAQAQRGFLQDIYSNNKAIDDFNAAASQPGGIKNFNPGMTGIYKSPPYGNTGRVVWPKGFEPANAASPGFDPSNPSTWQIPIPSDAPGATSASPPAPKVMPWSALTGGGSAASAPPVDWEAALRASLNDPDPNVRAEMRKRLVQMTPGLSTNFAGQ